MKVKYLLLLLVVLTIFSSVSALETIGTFKQSECVSIIQTCDNCSYINVSSIISPNSSILITNEDTTKSGTFYNRSFCDTDDIGTYLVNGFGDSDGRTDVWAYSFKITPKGYEEPSEIFTMFIYLLFIFTVAGLFVSLFTTVSRFVLVKTNLLDILVSFGLWILLIIVVYLGETFLITPYVANLSNLFLTATRYTHIVLPIIAYIAACIIRAAKKKGNLSVNDVSGGLG